MIIGPMFDADTLFIIFHRQWAILSRATVEEEYQDCRQVDTYIMQDKGKETGAGN